MPIRKLKQFKQWSHLGLNGELVFYKPKDIPFITYSNHTPCYEANAYIHHMLTERMLSKDSIRAFAHQIMHLVRFTEKQPGLTRFSQLTDATFTLFIHTLQVQKAPLGELRRSNNTVRKIGYTCLNFLLFVQGFHHLKNFIGKDKENAIRIIEKPYRLKLENYKGHIEGIKVNHTSIPTKEAENQRHPISEDDALRVWEHIKTQKNKDKRRRDMALYTAMEQTGARVSELLMIKMSDYIISRHSNLLTLTTLKRKDRNATRKVPISHILLSVIADYIKVRKRVMKKRGVSHDYLFINLNTGQKLTSSSWTTYMNSWKKELKISGRLHPHLWRHAFVTDKLKELILTTEKINNKDDFRRTILHTQTLKMKLQQWTGHKMLSSLDTYIDLAFSDINGYTKVYDAISLKASVNLATRQITFLEEQITKKEISITEAFLNIKDLLCALQDDISKSTN